MSSLHDVSRQKNNNSPSSSSVASSSSVRKPTVAKSPVFRSVNKRPVPKSTQEREEEVSFVVSERSELRAKRAASEASSLQLVYSVAGSLRSPRLHPLLN